MLDYRIFVVGSTAGALSQVGNIAEQVQANLFPEWG